MNTRYPNPSAPLPGFAGIPLFPADLAPFGTDAGTSGRALWALHRDATGQVTGKEMVYGGDGGCGGYGFTRGGRKGLFRSTATCRSRLVLVDGPIQAIACAALEGADVTAGTTYAAPGGPWTRVAGEALEALLRRSTLKVAVLGFAPARDGTCRSATACLDILSAFPDVAVKTLCPPAGSWVEALRAARRVRH
jgi:hypothetical protein